MLSMTVHPSRLSLTCMSTKRTPDNLYPDEIKLNAAFGWNCTTIFQQSYGGGTTPVFHETIIPSWHPDLSTIWNGTCDTGQLTRAGLEDAIRHGKVRLVSDYIS
jgi:2-phosphoxylose phosphatase